MSKTLDRLQAVVEAATPGPWHTYEYDSRIGHHTGVRQQSFPGHDLSTTRGIEDATFIATARNTYPEALAVVRAAAAGHRPVCAFCGGPFPDGHTGHWPEPNCSCTSGRGVEPCPIGPALAAFDEAATWSLP